MQEEVKEAPRSLSYIIGEGILRMMGKIASRDLRQQAAKDQCQHLEACRGGSLNVSPHIGGKLTKVRVHDNISGTGIQKVLDQLSSGSNIHIADSESDITEGPQQSMASVDGEDLDLQGDEYESSDHVSTLRDPNESPYY